MIFRFFFLLVVFLSAIPAAFAQPQLWRLPLALDDSNTHVTFTLDSTWHEVQGTTKDVRGKAWLANGLDPTSVLAEVEFPVASFDTDNTSRDERMREVLESNSFPSVKLQIHKVLGLEEVVAGSVSLDAQHPLPVVLEVSLSIKDVTQKFQIKAEISAEANRYSLKGETKIRWDSFGVEDPSILVARLHKEMLIHFHVSLSE